ncbi:FAD-dependent oxidoreductase [Nocardioides cavernaquae]|uniref:Cholesterol oxidase n=1 Tax=Nocardioides cavernaquae TaxID=2321396 RepID=A0A3A5H9I6_9ACTN|nr:GMC family oxidoreductase [Nocardioides cavernaquae]RJS46691.1 GMC family oxidoreductase [Nocardioides cavernaquae]
MGAEAFDYDVLVVGSGFGGSVTALRLTEKGYRVGVLEAGRRFADDDFAKTNWDVKNFYWAPRLRCFGIQRIRVLKNVVVLAGAGVGGGSLVYANTLYEPQTDAFFKDRQWAGIADWKQELTPHYDQAKRMLGVTLNPTVTAADEVLKKVAGKMGVGDSYHAAPVGVFFGRDGAKEPGTLVEDPFFGGAGPARNGCLECGECMVGCRHNAKNTLVKNYLHLAEKAGAEVLPMTTVVGLRQREDGAYAVEVAPTGKNGSRHRRTLTAREVVLAAGTWGTQELLHQMKMSGSLPHISDRLGHLTRTNSESICSASLNLRNRKDQDFHHGVAITSSIHPDERTHIEPVRYGQGSNSMSFLQTVMTDGGGRTPRPLRWLLAVLRHPLNFLALYLGIKDWSNRTIIALVMQTHDNSITVFGKKNWRGRIKLSSRQGHGEPNPTWIPAANEATRLMAEEIGGAAYGSTGEIFDIPMTAHFLGGAVIGTSPEDGVIDAYHRVFGHTGLHVVDGAAISANIGVNPSLTITAQAERAMSLWPNKGEADQRPPLGAAYQRIAAVLPTSPVVPPTAPAALRLPIFPVQRTGSIA